MASIFDLAGRRVLVTGGAKGIGRRTVQLLAEAGARVLIGDIDEAAEGVAADARGAGGAVDYVRLDVTREEDWRGAAQIAVDMFGGLDGLVNNAGFIMMKALFDTSLEDWRRQQQVNVEGVFLGMKTCAPLMASAGGSIVNLSSIYGLVGAPGFTAYCASKGAVRLLTKAAALEFGRAGLPIRVNSVHPGVIDTDLAHVPLKQMQAAGRLASLEEGREAVRQRHPIGRWGQPQDIASAALFLLSEASGFMTGAELVVDGGYTAD